jgi:GDP-L-fucose synthase
LSPANIEGKRIFVAGHKGMVGSAIVRGLSSYSCEILSAGRETLDLLDQRSVEQWMRRERPDIVILAAARVGGILANDTQPAQFLYENLMISTNVINAAHMADVNRLLNLGSSCIYPKFANQPIDEASLLTGPLESTNEWYAIAKIAALKMAQAYRRQYGRDYISAMPSNLYGPGDNYDLRSSHVIPALIRKAHEAKVQNASTISIWGSGLPRREFLHSDDCAKGCVFLLEHYSEDLHINLGSGEDISILDLAKLICKVVGFGGSIELDRSKPDGTQRKLMSGARIAALGWKPEIPLENGLAHAYAAFLAGIVK